MKDSFVQKFISFKQQWVKLKKKTYKAFHFSISYAATRKLVIEIRMILPILVVIKENSKDQKKK